MPTETKAQPEPITDVDITKTTINPETATQDNDYSLEPKTVPQQNTLSHGIDDSMVVDFSLEKFKSITFSKKKNLGLFFEDTFAYFTQSFFSPIFNIFFRTYFTINISGKEHLKDKKGPLLFISNHIGMYDAFLFDLFVPPFSKILPFRFMGTRVFRVPVLKVLKKIGIVDIIYLFFGVFRITPGEGAEKSLKKAYEIIKHGGTVSMYPEGRIWRPNSVNPDPIGPFKWGAAILAKNTDVTVIPVAFKRTAKFGMLRPKIEIQIGKPLSTDKTKSPEQIAEDMRSAVVGLYNLN